MKNNIRLFFFAAIAVLIPLCSIAQEFIKEPLHLKKDNSMIREISRGCWLVYSHYDYFAWFTLVDENNIFVHHTYNSGLCFGGDIVISDFEILGKDMVYYCGKRYVCDSNAWKGVFGYFDLSTFTSLSSFSEVELPELNGVFPEKIDFYVVDGNIHLVMVANTPATGGDAKPTTGVIIEAIGTGINPTTNWQINYAINGTLRYDDIAVTDNYVVATARNISQNHGYVVSFNKSTSSACFISSIGLSYYPNGYPHSAYYYSANDTILIEACEKDYYATVTYSTDPSINGTVVYAHNPSGLYAKIYMPPLSGVDPLLQVRDIKYNPYGKTLNLLQHFRYNGQLSSAIFHLDTTLVNPPSMPTNVYGNAFRYHKLSSIDRLLWNSNHIIASGHIVYPEEWNLLLVYQHEENVFRHCTNPITNTCFTIDKGNNTFYFVFSTPHYDSEVNQIMIEHWEHKIMNVCD
ncbi:MAG: hypothetical protein J6W88_01730 [Bacteroidales bacterium]|nr:hypothetical protein [Bacteroidales bacterium]